MPTTDRYARYRSDQTTIWVSKSAADFLSRERTTPGEGAAAVLDRMINDYKKMRRTSGAGPVGAAATKSAAKAAPAKAPAANAAKAPAAKMPATKSAGAGTRGTRSAARGGAAGGTRGAKPAR